MLPVTVFCSIRLCKEDEGVWLPALFRKLSPSLYIYITNINFMVTAPGNYNWYKFYDNCRRQL